MGDIMADEFENYYNKIEVLVNVFTVDKGILKVLLLRKDDEPYQGYWMLPNGLLYNNETIDNCANDIVYEMTGLRDIKLRQSNVYSSIDRIPNNRIIADALVGLVDSTTVKLENRKSYFECKWFDINSIPKTVFDHSVVISDAIDYLKEKILKSNVLKGLYPSDFTLPEIQKLYEQILGKKLDRRNFRKKMLNLDLIEPTGYKNTGFNGRPAILYKFKDDIENLNVY